MDGSHWIALFVNGLEREVFYFDSLALPTSKLIEEKFLKKFPRIVKNRKAYQSPFSHTCAHFCIVFIFLMSQGNTFDQILCLLEKQNCEMFVKLFVNKLIN